MHGRTSWNCSVKTAATKSTFESSRFNLYSIGSVPIVEDDSDSDDDDENRESVFVKSEDDHAGDASTAAAALASAIQKMDGRRQTFSSTCVIPRGRPGQGRCISKIAAVFELQQCDLRNNPILPLHRLDRIAAMAQRAKNAVDEDAVALPGEMLHLGDDVALAFIGDNGDYTLWIARVVKILCKVGVSKTTQYIRPVSLDTMGLSLVCGYYTEVADKVKKRKKGALQRYSYSTRPLTLVRTQCPVFWGSWGR